MSEPVQPRRRSWLLIISLCLNIALVPVIAAVVIRAMHVDTQIGSGGVLAPRSLMAALPDQRANIQKVIDAHTAKIRALRRDSVRTRMDAFELLGSPGYTPDRMAAAFAAITAADAALERESVAMLNDTLAVLTPAERQAVVERVRRRNRSWLFRMFRPRER
jgi:Spy/CpxP family protein refolding chaperone